MDFNDRVAERFDGVACVLQMRVGSPPGSPLHYFEVGLYPVVVPSTSRSRHKIPPSNWAELENSHKTNSLKNLAKQYGVSRESIRRDLRAAATSPTDHGTTRGPLQVDLR